MYPHSHPNRILISHLLLDSNKRREEAEWRSVIFVKAMPSLRYQLRQRRKMNAERKQQKSINELIQTIKALDIIGQRGSSADVQFRNRLRTLISSKAQQ